MIYSTIKREFGDVGNITFVEYKTTKGKDEVLLRLGIQEGQFELFVNGTLFYNRSFSYVFRHNDEQWIEDFCIEVGKDYLFFVKKWEAADRHHSLFLNDDRWLTLCS